MRALLLTLVCTAAVAGEPCDNIGGTYWHMFGNDNGGTSTHFRVEECYTENEVTYCEYGFDFNDTLNASWSKYKHECPMGVTASECARTLITPTSMAACNGNNEEGTCVRIEGFFYQEPGMPSCAWKWDFQTMGSHYVGGFRFSRDGEVGFANLKPFAAHGKRILGAPTLTFMLLRHPEPFQP